MAARVGNGVDISLDEYIREKYDFFRSIGYDKFFPYNSSQQLDEQRNHTTLSQPSGSSESTGTSAQDHDVVSRNLFCGSSWSEYKKIHTKQRGVSRSSILHKTRSGNSKSFWQHDDRRSHSRRTSGRVRSPTLSPSSWVLVANLPLYVTRDELRTVFAEIGKLRQVVLHHDAFGRFLGTAAIQYRQVGDALAALRASVTYDGRPMKILMASRL